MNEIKWPDFLSPGDHVALVATARHADTDEIKKGIDFLESWGLKVVIANNVFKKHHIFAGTEAERRRGLQEALDDPNIKAIFCLRGGYGTHRIVDFIHYQSIKKRPKWVIGYSDVTVFLNHLAQYRIPSIHGPMPFTFHQSTEQEGVNMLQKILFGELPSYKFATHLLNRVGEVEGRLIGGNLSVLHAMTGTESDIAWKNKILFIEEVDEYIYHIERMLYHFSRMGRLENLSGIVVGHLTSIKDNQQAFGLSVYEVIEKITRPYKTPLAFSFPAGHELPNMPIVIGAPVKLIITDQSSSLTFIK